MSRACPLQEIHRYPAGCMRYNIILRLQQHSRHLIDHSLAAISRQIYLFQIAIKARNRASQIILLFPALLFDLASH